MKDLTIGFIGLGLIGGSIARGIKRSRRDVRIMAYMRSRDKLEQAKRDGVVDVILDGIGEEISWCDLVFLCTPVSGADPPAFKARRPGHRRGEHQNGYP